MASLPLKYFIFVTALCLSVAQVSSLHFNYSPTIPDEYKNDFIYRQGSNLAGGALQITMDSRNAPLVNLSGRVFYKRRFKLWRDRRSVVASFNTSFVLNIETLTKPFGGEGLAFILTSNSTVPSDSYGKWLGIVNEETNGSPSNHVVAVEFDTRKSYETDVDGNHVGVDVNAIESIVQFPLEKSNIDLSSGKDVKVRIGYDGKSHFMTVDLSMEDDSRNKNSNSSFSFRIRIDLSEFLMEDVYVGFSASTSNLTELNCIKSWNFTGTKIEKNKWVKLKWILPASVSAVVLFGGIAIFCICCWRKRNASIRQSQSSIDTSQIEKCLQKFRLRELISATSNFDRRNELGRGGFGIVYLGSLKRGLGKVAIKRLLKDSCQREKEFLSELTTIGTLRHKNLVKLIGWCSEKDELLLVYEYMPKGSLDKLIYQSPDMENMTPLNWDKRYNILIGVASALCYLHDASNHKKIFHRDVKPSNVMLNCDYHALLGDFGLARTVEEDGKTHHTTKVLAGTACYVAPEYCATGRATMKTDIYAFGALTMEVARGMKPTVNHVNYSENNLVNEVWDLYGEDRILDAADGSLGGAFDEVQMEIVLKLGLICCHPDENQRPSASSVMKILEREEVLPDLPKEKPSSVSLDAAASSLRLPYKGNVPAAIFNHDGTDGGYGERIFPEQV